MVNLQQHRPESDSCLDARVGSPRDLFCSWCSRSPLSLTAGELLPPPGSLRLMVCFAAFVDGKVLAWSKQDHEGWPPTQCMWFVVGFFYTYMHWSVVSLICCCDARIALSTPARLPSLHVKLASCILPYPKAVRHLERSHLLVLLVPCFGKSYPWSSGLLLGLDEECLCVALVNEGILSSEVMTAMPNYLLK